MARIGEILLEQGCVDAANLNRALADQRDTGKRLCSLMISRGQLAPDDAARALGAQHGVAAVLQRHLEHREPDLAKLIPAELAHRHVALPIGRMRNGAVIVCVRDPKPATREALVAALGSGQEMMLAVAPAHQLEQLVAQVYRAEDNEFDIDMSTGPVPSLAVPAAATGQLDNLGAITLVELDDIGVTKDPVQPGNSGSWQRTESSLSPQPPAMSRTSTLPQRVDPSIPAVARTSTLPPRQVDPSIPAVARTSTLPPRQVDPSMPAMARTSTLPPRQLDASPQATRTSALPPREIDPSMPAMARTSTLPPRQLDATSPAAARVSALPPRQIDPSMPAMARTSTLPLRPGDPSMPEMARTSTVPSRRVEPAAHVEPPATVEPAAPAHRHPTLTDALAAMAIAPTAEAATDAAMAFVAGRWIAAVLLTIADGAALGQRGHGPQLSEDAVQAVAIPMTSPSIVQAAHDERIPINTPPTGARTIQDRLERMLGQPKFAAAAPVIVATRVVCVLAVGDPVGDDLESAMDDLDVVTDALGEACTRIAS